MRWIVAAVIGAVLLLAAGGAAFAHFRSGNVSVASVQKASTCADAYRLLGLRPSQIADAKSVCLVQDLKFSGELSGSVAEAYPVGTRSTGPTAMCTVPKRWDGFPQALLAVVVGGNAYRFRISAPGSSEHQPLTFQNLTRNVELASIKDPGTDWNQATGTVSLGADGIEGSIDADLLRDVAGAQPVHVSGKWACGAPLQPPTFDANVPCANFYALNQLEDVDVARMRVSGCHAQGLTFSGAINGKVDYAVTDTISPQASFGADNLCLGYDVAYTATLKFALGDESFLLDLFANRYPAVVPGPYPLTGTNGRPGSELYLGHADPTYHGDFVINPQVSWFGTSGTYTIAPDMKSGTIDGELEGLLGPSDSTVHISGSWRCAA